MKPVPFDYEAPDSVSETVGLLRQHAGDAKIIAGGQSLMPMLNFRIVRPSILIDINRLIDLDYVREAARGGLQIGALARHRTLETSPLVEKSFPVICEAMHHVAHVAIRNRGTIGGSLSHADPAAELPLMAMLLDASIVVQSARGARSVPASDFFVGALTSALREDELVVRIDLPALPAHMGWAFEEFARRAGDFALASVAILLEVADGVIRAARIAMMGVGEKPLRLAAAESVLAGRPLTKALVEEVVEAACSPLQPNLDLHASPEYRRFLARNLTRRALRNAWKRVTGESL